MWSTSLASTSRTNPTARPPGARGTKARTGTRLRPGRPKPFLLRTRTSSFLYRVSRRTLPALPLRVTGGAAISNRRRAIPWRYRTTSSFFHPMSTVLTCGRSPISAMPAFRRICLRSGRPTSVFWQIRVTWWHRVSSGGSTVTAAIQRM